MQNKVRLLLVVLSVLAIGLASCENKMVYSHYEHTILDGWEKADTVSFDIPPLKHSGIYQEEIGLRINNDYPFMSLFLVIEQTIHPQGTKQSYRKNITLADKTGEATGYGISFHQYNIPLEENLTLHAGDSLHVSIIHFMKQDILPGISDIGITLKKE